MKKHDLNECQYSESRVNFARFISQVPFLHPSNRQQIDERTKRAIAEAVFGGSGVAGGMFDGGFQDGVAAHFDEGGEEAVHAIEELQADEAMAAIDFEARGGILDRFIAKPVADAVGHSRLKAAKAGVVSIFSPAGDHVVGRFAVGAIEHGEEAVDFFRIVLKIAVDGGDDLTARGFEAGIKCSALAPVAGHAKDAKPGIFFLAFGEQRGGFIGAAIIADDDFKRTTDAQQCRAHSFEQDGDVLAFVIDGDDQ